MGKQPESGNHARLFLAGEDFPDRGSTGKPVPICSEDGSGHERQHQPSVFRRWKRNRFGSPVAGSVSERQGPDGRRFEVDPVGTEVHPFQCSAIAHRPFGRGFVSF